MAWKIVDGQPQRAGVPEVRVALPPVEVVAADWFCTICGKEYKTERGLLTHLDSH